VNNEPTNHNVENAILLNNDTIENIAIPTLFTHISDSSNHFKAISAHYNIR